MTVKRHTVDDAPLPLGDYASPGLAVIVPDRFFPWMQLGDKSSQPWKYLRREVPHNWYVDRRHPLMGFVSRDEAILLYNIARSFAGRPALEIGCWMGWSTYHLAAGGVMLDVIDPALAQPENRQSVESALVAGGLRNAVRLHPVGSPDAVDRLAALRGDPWSLFFIDGDHEAPGPALDAEACIRYAAADAMAVFHDLTSPMVAEGLAVFQRAGWRTLIYHTMQIIGVAWRGAVTPVAHRADPGVAWTLPQHLEAFGVNGMGLESEVHRLALVARRLEDEKAEMATEIRQLCGERERLRQELKDVAAWRSSILTLRWLRSTLTRRRVQP
ncbi:MAG TPA: class I SAM-dependent methyltransferase [Stellaceae bacterium]|nr:class I SAM-dependent methyltransferase [Stellaceae bacterium]